MTTEEFKTRMIPYARKLYPMMKRMLGNDEEVKDALQELMIKLWNKKDSLEKYHNPDGFILTVARNFSIDILKKPKIRFSNHPEEMSLSTAAVLFLLVGLYGLFEQDKKTERNFKTMEQALVMVSESLQPQEQEPEMFVLWVDDNVEVIIQ